MLFEAYLAGCELCGVLARGQRCSKMSHISLCIKDVAESYVHFGECLT